MVRVGVDIGGTFTDAVAIDADGTIRTAKALTTPGKLHEGVLAAIDQLHLDWSELESITHGTTAGLNAFLERRGARTALVTTRGFRDVYELGRANRPDMYNVRYRPPAPLVKRRSVFEVHERLAADGSVVIPVDSAQVRELGSRLAAEYEAVAVCLLHAYANPIHEQEVAALLRSVAPELSVVLSHEVAPEWREYERTSTTVISAYIAPIVEQYLGELERRIIERGLSGGLKVMQSNGGVMTAATARTKPIQTLFSGPVGGTIASISVARDLTGEFDADRLVCVDMGGTSFDVSLVVDGKAEVELQSELQRHPVLAPAVAIHTIGAGGGSIGHVEGGGLRVGPRSAGAEPGPASYGAGGTDPTITDANLRLGRLPRSARLAGDLPLDLAAADTALATVGGALGLETTDLAAGMVAVADAAMANAIREITVLRGIDPRDFVLVAFGGAGPLHALSIAEELGISKVVVPADPGVLSAYGMLQSDTRHDVVQAFFVRLDRIDHVELDSAFAGLADRSREILAADGVGDDAMVLEPSVDLRYVGQEYTVTLPVDIDDGVSKLLERLPTEFALAHEARYGHSNPEEAVEFVNLRFSARGRIERPERRRLPASSSPVDASDTGTAWFDGSWETVAIYRRSDLVSRHRLVGPAIIMEEACTTLVQPGWEAEVSSHGHLLLSRTD